MPTTLTSRLPQIATSLPLRVGVAIRAGAEGVAEEAKMRVPVETGALRDAIHVESDLEGISVVAGNTQAFYGHIIEHGSVRAPAHPFLVPALESQTDVIVESVTAALRKL